mmetsp:Transcript_937/g.1450  ORF Transcript_937/g.1450 Transcript_937/m.1450 type:complete len:121 (+) Transcript_937:63-425(+)
MLNSAHTESLNNDIMSEIVESEERKAPAVVAKDAERSLEGELSDKVFGENRDDRRGEGALRQMKLSKNMRLDTTSAMSNLGLNGDHSPTITRGFSTKKNSLVPESFLVPMVLRKTKMRQQ